MYAANCRFQLRDYCHVCFVAIIVYVLYMRARALKTVAPDHTAHLSLFLFASSGALVNADAHVSTLRNRIKHKKWIQHRCIRTKQETN